MCIPNIGTAQASSLLEQQRFRVWQYGPCKSGNSFTGKAVTDNNKQNPIRPEVTIRLCTICKK